MTGPGAFWYTGAAEAQLSSGPTTHQGALTVAGSATFAAAASARLQGAWAVSGAGSFTAAARLRAAGTWLVAGAATFTAAGTLIGGPGGGEAERDLRDWQESGAQWTNFLR